MPLAVPLNILIYERGWRGQPTTNFLEDLGGRAETYEDSIGASIGFESMTATLTVTRDEAMDWLMNGLGRRSEVYDPDALPIWEGQLTTIEAQFSGGESRSRSLESMANEVVVRYLDLNGMAAQHTFQDSPSVEIYGIKQTAISGRARDGTAAGQLGYAHLASHAFPVWAYGTDVGGASQGGVALRLGFSGWYTTLGWQFADESDSTTLTGTATQVTNQLISFNGVNVFLSTNYTEIAPSGVTDTEQVAPDTTYRTRIEGLLEIGTSANQRLCWGVYEGRRFRARTWAGATPDVITYQRSFGENAIHDANGNNVPLWLVRPDAIYQASDLLDVTPVATTPDSAARSFVERVSRRIGRDSVGLRLEGQGGDTLDNILARIRA